MRRGRPVVKSRRARAFRKYLLSKCKCNVDAVDAVADNVDPEAETEREIQYSFCKVA